MLTGIAEKQDAFKMVVRQVASAYEGTNKSKAESIMSDLRTAGKMVDLDFEQLFTDYRADALMDKAETLLTEAESKL